MIGEIILAAIICFVVGLNLWDRNRLMKITEFYMVIPNEDFYKYIKNNVPDNSKEKLGNMKKGNKYE